MNDNTFWYILLILVIIAFMYWYYNPIINELMECKDVPDMDDMLIEYD